MPKPTIAITSGEPAGIGPDIICSLNPADFEARLIVIGDISLLRSRAVLLQSPARFVALSDETPGDSALAVIHLPVGAAVVPGELNVNNADYVLQTLNRSCDGCLSGEFDAMVTAPIQKDIINRAGIAFTGHTEYLAARCQASKPVMLLIAGQLRVALVTTHLPLRKVADAISFDLIIEIATILDQDLRHRFGLQRPHIKVCGLNPHAGENGYLGSEEIDIIIPAVQALREAGINISGPYPADTVFTPDALADADAVLAMYHDQGLPVLKHTGFHNAVNTTLGLPIIRSSVDHGTALDLAASGKAHPGSLFAAIKSAIAQSKCKEIYASGT
ncbi:MAG: 4-hydroxythreonine-4-phosphate dehydrogenase [Planctomycetota bacterium]|jgi:4-hydroxythreonine-4-phosphate dehydrogenase